MTRDYSEIKPYQYKPRYTEKDLETIRKMVEAGRTDNEIIYVMMTERPDVSLRSFERWIKMVRQAVEVLDTHAQA